MSPLTRLTYFARARQQEFAIALDDLRYAVRNRGSVTGAAYGTAELPALAASRWGKKAGAPFHVVYIGHPSNWEPHNIPADPGLAENLSTIWLRDLGFDAYAGGVLRRRREVGPAIHDRLAKIDAERPIHLVLAYLAGSHVLAEHVRAWRGLGVVTCGFHLDDRLFFRGARVDGIHAGPAATCSAFDLNLTNVRRSLTKYAACGARALFWPEGANPAFFRPLAVGKTHDIAFLGGRYGSRGTVVERLQRDGFTVLARGPGWPDGEVPGEQVTEVLNRGRIVLGFSGIGRSMRATCLKGRDFEVPMTGAAYVVSWNPELPLVYEIGREIRVWRSYPELRDIIAELLRDEHACSQLRMNALRRARAQHTWAHRVGELAAVFGHPWRPRAIEEIGLPGASGAGAFEVTGGATSPARNA